MIHRSGAWTTTVICRVTSIVILSFLLMTTIMLLHAVVVSTSPPPLHTHNTQDQPSFFNASQVATTFENILKLGDDSTLEAFGIASISVAVVHNNQIIFSRGYGALNPATKVDDRSGGGKIGIDIGSGSSSGSGSGSDVRSNKNHDLLTTSARAPDANSIYAIGTVTKTFTGTAILQLVDRGEIELDRNVNDYVRGFKPLKDELIGNVISWNGRPRVATKRHVTVHHLLTHTAGLDHRLSGIAAYGIQDQLPLSSYVQRYFPPRVRPPGVVSTYSQHHAATLLGLVVEEIVGEHYADHIQNEFFEPLDMNDTSYGYDAQLSNNPRFARPFKRKSDGTFVERSDYGKWLNIGPTGAIYSTANDMAKWAITHLNYGYNPVVNKRILRSQTAAMMYAEQFSNREGIPGSGYMFQRKTVNGVDFVHQTGTLDPYFSSLSLFHEHNVSLILLSTGSGVSSLDQIRAKFIEHTMLNYKLCTGQDEFLDPTTGFCLRTVLKDSVKPVTKDYVSRWKRYEGCYVTANHAHTGFFKSLLMRDLVICVRRSGHFLTVSSLKQTLIEVDLNLFTINYDNTLDKDGKSYLYDITNMPRLSFLDDEGVPLDLSNSTQNALHAQYIILAGSTFEYMPHLIAPNMIRSARDLFLIVLTFVIISSALLLFALAVHDVYKVKEICQDDSMIYGADEEYTSDDIYNGSPYGESQHLVHNEGSTHMFGGGPPSTITISCTLFTTALVTLSLLMVSILNLTNLIKVTSLSPTIYFVSHPLYMSMPFIATLFASLMLLGVVPMLVLRHCTRLYFGQWYSMVVLVITPPTLLVNICYIVFISYFNIFLHRG